MSISNLKWIKGAPAELLTGMAVRCRGEVLLVGSFTPPSIASIMLADCTEHTQAIHDYELDWLSDMGVPAKAAQ